MVAPAHRLLPDRSRHPAVPSARTEEPDLYACGAESARTEAPLTSEPPLPDAEPLTSEPPLAAADPDVTRP
ncbi:hypothetical protein [Streptomyces sp. NPDC003522]